jgi:hypothetical protein
MIRVSLSLWLPIGRANFFSVPEDREFLHVPYGASRLKCSAALDHHPNLQVSTFRRLLEVLPASYGYDATAVCESAELADDGQPVKVTLSLTPEHGHDESASYRRARTNGALIQAGVTALTLTVTEDGFFTWIAEAPGDGGIATGDFHTTNRYGDDPQHLVREALRAHVKELFGGEFSLRRYDRKGQVSGDEAAETYRGKKKEGCKRSHTPHGTTSADADGRPHGAAEHYPPLGILTFFQLNILLEGLINETLLPAVFFEEYAFLQDWMREESHSRGFRSLGAFVELLLVDADATCLGGQITTLDHFLAVTAREVLQKIKWSVESVRRGLLDEMMSVLHRQSSLNQLGLGSFERSPEQAGDANESQLRGYVMLVAAKLPLITNVHRFARSALSRLALELNDFTTAESTLPHNYSDLKYQLDGWRDLLDALGENIHGLETAIEHAWMERLLYEQEQVRAEQEAMAEIERSRNGRRPLISPETAINSAVLIFAVAAVVLTAKTASEPAGNHPLWTLLLWPSILGLGVLVLAIGWTVLTRYLKIWRSTTDVYDYEFAFRLDLEADESKTRRYLELSGPESITASGFGKFRVLRRGGARIERITPDSSLVKLHSAIVFRPDARFWRRSRARFEIVTEILGHRASNKNQYILRESRIFGDTSRPLAPDKVMDLVTAALTVTAGRLLSDKLDVEKIINLAAPVFTDRTTAEEAENSTETVVV